MLKNLTRSYYLMIALVFLFATSSALAAAKSHHAKARAAHDSTRGTGGSKGKQQSGATRSEKSRQNGTSATTVLVGDDVVEPHGGLLQPGQAQAFRLRASATGTAAVALLYISSGNAAKTVTVGLYGDGQRHPHALLSTGTAVSSQPGSWTTIAIHPTAVVRSKHYWLAIMGDGGQLRYRDSGHRSCPGETSKSNLRALPASWRTRARSAVCPASIYLAAGNSTPASESGLLLEAPLAETGLGEILPPQTITPPGISGTPAVGRALEASSGAWTGSPTAWAYEWEDCDAAGEGCSAIDGATASSYRPVAADVGHALRVVVTASNAGGSAEASSEATEVVVAEAPLSAPSNTALPAIGGTAEGGRTLTASEGSWTGSPTSFAYQWEDCNLAGGGCSQIGGATSASYRLVSGDVGHRLRVVVSASNAGGSAEASSEATEVVVAEAPPSAPSNTALPKVSGTVQEAKTLTASEGSWTGNPTSFAYRWEDCGAAGEACSAIAGATSASYKLVAGDVGHTLRVVVTATNAGGSAKASSEATGTALPAAPVDTVLPKVSGTVQEAKTLTASEGSWSGSPTSFAYQWEDCNLAGGGCSEVAGATSASYKLVAGDVGHTLRVVVTATNAGGSAKASSEATGTVLPLAPVDTVLPKVSGTVQEAKTLTASEGAWTGSPTSFAYQWEDCSAAGEACSAIAGATSASYKLVAGDVGHTLRVVVTATNAGGSAKASSEATGTALPAAPVDTVLPKVSGTVQEAKTLTASEGSWSGSPTSFAYQWEDCNLAGGGCSEIAGATGVSYKLVAGDVGHTLRVVVTATNVGGSAKASSEATGTVLPLAPVNTVLPKVSGAVQEAKTLTASEGAWTGTPTSFAYQWEDCNTSGEACSAIGGATSASYKLASADVGHTLRVVVTATNAGGSAKASSEATGTVLPLAPVDTVLPKVSGTVQEAKTLTASEGSWSGSPTSFAYQWEDCNTSGEACSAIGGATSSSYKLASGDVGHTLRVTVTATNAGGSAKASSEATGTVLPPAPVNTALPSVSGTVQEAKTLTASEGSWSGSPTSFAYQWEDCNTGGEACSAIGGATSASYKLASADVGHTLRVVVTATNAGGSAKASSEATGTVLPLAPVDTVLPKVSGTVQEAKTLTASEGSWSGSPTSFAYQWEDCNAAGEACSAIGGATSSSYKLASGDVGHTLRVLVTATNAGGSAKASSEATGTVLPLAPVNTVLPKVSGTAEEGLTLTAAEGSWTGTPTSFAYQWEDCNAAGEGCANVGGATSSSYKLVAGDVGHTLRVAVTATNAGGSAKASSEATGTVVPPTPVNTALPEVGGTAEDGQTLTASEGSWTGTPTSFAYRWEDCNTSGEACSAIGGATSSSYKLVSGDLGHTLRVLVTASNAGGSGEASSEATGTVVVAPVPVNTVLPKVSGAVQEAKTLTAAEGAWTGSPTSYAYQWEDCNAAGEACSEIGGATSASYKLVAGDVGHTLRVAVTASNAGGSASASSEATGTVSPAAPVNTALPKVSGTVQEGQVLTASEGSWSGSPTSFGYQWEDCNAAGEGCVNINGAMSANYKLVSADVGHTLRVAVTATNAGGPGQASSEATGTVAPPAPVSTAQPTIGGSAEEGQTLTASEGSWTGSPTSYAYQWEDCNTAGEACSEIGGATSASYKLLAGDVGHTLRVAVTASNAGGSGEASSEATGTVVVAPAPVNTALPAVSGTVQEAKTLAASEGSWSGSPTSFAYQWEDCNAAGEACSAIGGATSASYKLASGDVGHTLRVLVTATNAGGSAKASSEATGTVLPLAPVNTVLPKVSGTVQEAKTLTASEGSWTGTPTSFVYQWEDCNATGESCANIGGATSVSYKLVAGDVGHTLRVAVTATNAGGSAKASSGATGTVLPAAPVNAALPTVGGAAQEGQVLAASEGSWSGSPTSFAYQWEDCNAAGEACSAIGGATSSSYKLASGDVGHTLRVLVTATNAGGSAKASSEATGTVLPAAPVNTALPKISGAAEEGLTLTASEGSWTGTPASFAYQWEDCNTSGEACSAIGGATSASYKLVSGDVGHTLRVLVTATNAAGSGKASSEATGTVVAAHTAGPQTYVSQSGAGTKSGEGSCSNAESLSWMRNEGHWGAGAGQIGPGATVNLCGTFTEAVYVWGNGEPGRQVTILFTSGSKIAPPPPGCPSDTGCLDLIGGEVEGHRDPRYITVTSAAGYKGQLWNPGRTYENEPDYVPTATKGIKAFGCRYCNIENLEIGPLLEVKEGQYVSDNEIDGIYLLNEDGEPEHDHIRNDYFRDLGWSIVYQSGPNSNNIFVEDNTFYHQTHGFSIGTTGSYSVAGAIVFAHNYIYGSNNWGFSKELTGKENNHTDGIHCFSGKLPHYSTGLFIYDNTLVQETVSAQSDIFLEGGGGSECADKTSPIWIFNNVIAGAEGGNGMAGLYAGEDHVLDNTFVGFDEKEAANCLELATAQPVIQKPRVENNIFTSCNHLAKFEPKLVQKSDYNLWAKGIAARSEWNCPPSYQTALSEFTTCIQPKETSEAHSMVATSAKVKERGAQGVIGQLESGSEAKGNGANLATTCEEMPTEFQAACKENILGETRSAPWNIGAY